MYIDVFRGHCSNILHTKDTLSADFQLNENFRSFVKGDEKIR